ncbi:MAG: hypothetical protein ACR2P1_25310 [Pseudomonadales bacterium]
MNTKAISLVVSAIGLAFVVTSQPYAEQPESIPATGTISKQRWLEAGLSPDHPAFAGASCNALPTNAGLLAALPAAAMSEPARLTVERPTWVMEDADCTPPGELGTKICLLRDRMDNIVLRPNAYRVL